MLARPISLDLLSDVFVEMREPLVRHMFDTHNRLLLLLITQQFFSFTFQARPGEQSIAGFSVCFWTHSARRSQLAGEPAHGVSLQGVYGNGNFLDAMAGAALESTFFKAPLARRNPSQSHPVFAGETHRPLYIRR
jgi:hypothetical protein